MFCAHVTFICVCARPVASASQDFTIVVWDATPSRHKPIGLCTGHTSEIVALQFAYPYPILLSADVTVRVLLQCSRDVPLL